MKKCDRVKAKPKASPRHLCTFKRVSLAIFLAAFCITGIYMMIRIATTDAVYEPHTGEIKLAAIKGDWITQNPVFQHAEFQFAGVIPSGYAIVIRQCATSERHVEIVYSDGQSVHKLDSSEDIASFNNMLPLRIAEDRGPAELITATNQHKWVALSGRKSDKFGHIGQAGCQVEVKRIDNKCKTTLRDGKDGNSFTIKTEFPSMTIHEHGKRTPRYTCEEVFLIPEAAHVEVKCLGGQVATVEEMKEGGPDWTVLKRQMVSGRHEYSSDGGKVWIRDAYNRTLNLHKMQLKVTLEHRLNNQKLDNYHAKSRFKWRTYEDSSRSAYEKLDKMSEYERYEEEQSLELHYREWSKDMRRSPACLISDEGRPIQCTEIPGLGEEVTITRPDDTAPWLKCISKMTLNPADMFTALTDASKVLPRRIKLARHVSSADKYTLVIELPNGPVFKFPGGLITISIEGGGGSVVIDKFQEAVLGP